MILKIDYISEHEQIVFMNQQSDEKLWESFYTFLCDYLPAEAIVFTESIIEFSWRYFLMLKSYIKVFLKSHRHEIQLEYSDKVKELMLQANKDSYTAAVKRPENSREEIKAKLISVGFMRPLTDNQLNNLCKISVLPGAATFSVPGAGKTTEALAFFFVNCKDTDRLLIAAPKNAFVAWDEQLKECLPNLDEQIVRLRGGKAVISELLKLNPRFMIISYEQLVRVPELISKVLSNGDTFFFLDESHRIKGGKQAKRAEVVLQMAHLPKRKLIMSGTPMPQSAKDLIPQFTFLYPSTRVDEKNVIDMIQPIHVRTTKGQLGIPEVDHKVVTINMNALQREIYDSLKSEAKRQMNPHLSDTSIYELRRIGKCIIKIMQFVSNPALLSDDMSYIFNQKIGQLLASGDGPKIAYVCKRARQLAAEGEKVLIWSSFVRNVELLALRLSDLGAEYIHGGVDAGSEDEMDTREGKIKRFHDDPNCKVLVANPAACSEGISLHTVCHHAIYLDRSFNAAQYLQSEDRIHRLGISDKPYVEFVECNDSIDQVIRARLGYKISAMAAALNDTSLKVNPDGFEFDDEDTEYNENNAAIAGLTAEDVQAILNHLFHE